MILFRKNELFIGEALMSKSVEIGDECPMNIAFNVLDGKYKLNTTLQENRL